MKLAQNLFFVIIIINICVKSRDEKLSFVSWTGRSNNYNFWKRYFFFFLLI